MEKRFVLVFVAAILLVSSCSTASKVKFVFDESVPLEESTWVALGIGDVTSYNEIPVKWRQVSYVLDVYQIPAGETLLEWDIWTNYFTGESGYRGSGVLLKYNFLPGKKYFLRVVERDNTVGVEVYCYDIDEKPMVYYYNDNDHRLAYVPFLNVVAVVTRTTFSKNANKEEKFLQTIEKID